MNIVKQWNVISESFDSVITYTYPRECTDEDFNGTSFNREFKKL